MVGKNVGGAEVYIGIAIPRQNRTKEKKKGREKIRNFSIRRWSYAVSSHFPVFLCVNRTFEHKNLQLSKDTECGVEEDEIFCGNLDLGFFLLDC